MIARAALYINFVLLPALFLGWFFGTWIAYAVCVRPETPVWACNLIAAAALFIPGAVGGVIGALVFREVHRQEECESNRTSESSSRDASNQ
jgi:hypothetical protein